MIDLTKLPAHEAEAVAYAEGFAAAAQLFARIADLEAENERLEDVDWDNQKLKKEVYSLRDELAAVKADLVYWQDEAAWLADLLAKAKAMHEAKK